MFKSKVFAPLYKISFTIYLNLVIIITYALGNEFFMKQNPKLILLIYFFVFIFNKYKYEILDRVFSYIMKYIQEKILYNSVRIRKYEEKLYYLRGELIQFPIDKKKYTPIINKSQRRANFFKNINKILYFFDEKLRNGIYFTRLFNTPSYRLMIMCQMQRAKVAYVHTLIVMPIFYKYVFMKESFYKSYFLNHKKETMSDILDILYMYVKFEFNNYGY